MINEKPLSTEERKSLKDKEFGIPELRAYPLNDVSHVEQAVRMFNYVEPEYEKELADNLNKAIKKFGLKINVGDTNRFKKYVKESRVMSREQSVSSILESLNYNKVNEGMEPEDRLDSKIENRIISKYVKKKPCEPNSVEMYGRGGGLRFVFDKGGISPTDAKTWCTKYLKSKKFDISRVEYYDGGNDLEVFCIVKDDRK